MELLHNFYHNKTHSPDNSLMRILRDGYLRCANESGQYGMVNKRDASANDIFLSLNISREPYAALHLDWRLLLENTFQLHLGWGCPAYNPYDAVAYLHPRETFTQDSVYDFRNIVIPQESGEKSLYSGAKKRDDTFRGAQLTERQLQDLLTLYRKQNDIRPEIMPRSLTEITVSRRIPLHKYLRAVSADWFSIPTLTEVVAMYPNIRVYAARKDIPKLKRAIPGANFEPRVRTPVID